MAVQTLRAWFDYLAVRMPRHVRRMEYVRDARALHVRGNRCRGAWRPHLENTRALILEAAAR